MKRLKYLQVHKNKRPKKADRLQNALALVKSLNSLCHAAFNLAEKIKYSQTIKK